MLSAARVRAPIGRFQRTVWPRRVPARAFVRGLAWLTLQVTASASSSLRGSTPALDCGA